jgi:hypothetical protein
MIIIIIINIIHVSLKEGASVPKSSLFHPLLMYCEELNGYTGTKCLFNKKGHSITMFNDFNDIQSQTLLSFEKKTVINNQVP